MQCCNSVHPLGPTIYSWTESFWPLLQQTSGVHFTPRAVGIWALFTRYDQYRTSWWNDENHRTINVLQGIKTSSCCEGPDSNKPFCLVQVYISGERRSILGVHCWCYVRFLPWVYSQQCILYKFVLLWHGVALLLWSTRLWYCAWFWLLGNYWVTLYS